MNKLIQMAIAGTLLLVPNLVVAKGQQVNQQLEVPTNARVVIDTMRGKVDVQGTNANVAKVVGTIDENAEDFIFELNGNTLTIHVKMPNRGNFSNNDGNDLKISLPNTARVEAQSVSADFNVNAFTGSVVVSSVSGDITATRLTGGANLETVSGDIEGRNLAGELTLQSVSGDVEDQGSDSSRATYGTVSGDVKATTNARVVRAEAVSGDVQLNLASVDSLHINNVSGDVEVSTALNERARVNVETVSGDTTLKLRGDIHADIDARASAGGDIVNRLNQVKAEQGKYGMGQSLKLELGERSSSMSLRSVSGTIVLEK
ncbi:DUF4097 family beta strand repeat-containing protein [Pseudidiomarina donghaiensis]|uniref:DUF4097 domain-containing protein n=1 Tax=Pseudidiomarina donghaiensis TaxID=519452 RepID=A0A432XEJ8_9GAMM|nr:DUF4097 family beta strand repeat-containing protein [Pseudidiomarina donghaiensis]RUO47062.1 hypothetical protein CWE24_10070 [Pseudidiomarina donghaiensis]SFV23565.1 DUF4097 and DUF4098 domain-containing protein YvlB [Pseudidiomarina donghaiensis]